MCGRYTLRADRVKVAETLRLSPESLPVIRPRYNVSPTQSVLTVRNIKPDEDEPAAATADGGRVADESRWGLVPSWAKSLSIGARMINARGETVATKPAFRAAFKRRRCLIPCDGMYEWPEPYYVGKQKWPVHIHFDGDEVFALAGLFENWQSPEGDWIRSASIITAEPNSLVAPLHDRMGVILPEEHWDEWLDRDNEDTKSLQRLLVPFPADRMRIRLVSPNVNNARNEGEHLLAIAPEHPGQAAAG